MKSLILTSSFLVMCISSCIAKDLLVGSISNTQLIYQETKEYHGIPFIKRVREWFYTDIGQRIIKGIVARDVKGSEASAIVTAGGVGFSYVNVRLKSERGKGLGYHFEIYV